MLIHPVSDLHLEFLNPFRQHVEQALAAGYGLHLPRGEWGPEGRDVVVVAGDAHLDVRAPGWLRYLYGDCEIIYTPGNHEYYGADLATLDEELRRECERYGIHFLQCDSVEIGGVVFAGCTLWTDFAAYEPVIPKSEAGRMAQEALADYNLITVANRSRGEGRKITWTDTAKIHQRHKAWLEEEIEKHQGRELVIITHHMPILMTAPDFEGDPVTGAFCNRLNDLVRSSGAKYWICGHTHFPGQAQIGETLVINNSCGYPEEDNGYQKSLVLEL